MFGPRKPCGSLIFRVFSDCDRKSSSREIGPPSPPQVLIFGKKDAFNSSTSFQNCRPYVVINRRPQMSRKLKINVAVMPGSGSEFTTELNHFQACSKPCGWGPDADGGEEMIIAAYRLTYPAIRSRNLLSCSTLPSSMIYPKLLQSKRGCYWTFSQMKHQQEPAPWNCIYGNIYIRRKC